MPHIKKKLSAVSRQLARSPFFLIFLRAAQPSRFFCGTRVTASAPSGTSRVIVEPAPTYAPAPTVTGATNWLSLPMNAPAPIEVRCLRSPS